MKRKILFIGLIFGLVVFGLSFVNSNVYSQEDPIKIPFRDRNGDGINDLIQSYMGARILNRIQQRQELGNLSEEERQELREKRQNMTEEERQKLFEGRKQLLEDWEGMDLEERQKMLEGKFNEMVDTDNDGTPDTKLGALFQNRNFRMFDKDGSGKPDMTREEFRERMKEMRAKRLQGQEPKN